MAIASRANHCFLWKKNSRSVVCAAQTIAQPSKVKFNDGSSTQFCPILNGCWTLAGGHGQEVFDGVNEKLKAHALAGFTTFDTADIYGPSEQILGRFQDQWTQEQPEPVQVFTKFVPNIFKSVPKAKDVERAVRVSMNNLKVNSLDLVQMHWWDYGIPGMEDTALALADCKEKGLVRSVGMTNLDVPAMAKLCDAGVPIVSNQVQFSLLDRRPLNGMVEFCQSKNIRILAYGSVAAGLLSDRYIEAPGKSFMQKSGYPQIRQDTPSKRMYSNVMQYFGGVELWQDLLKTLRTVADKHGVTTANVAMRWVMDQGQGNMVHPIVGVRSTDHILDNARCFGLTLDDEDRGIIDEVLARAVGPSGDIYSFERA